MEADVLRGNLEGLLLSVLEPGGLHGYAVIEELKRRSGSAIDLPSGTVYPALHRLEAARLVRSEWAVVGGRRRRTYHLTTAGQRALSDKRTAWREVSSLISVVLGGGS
ncbi:MAG: PadR family transcriptional regulator [Streptomyces sp.]|nr:PadR family transcriptional regulator [Streptomyces sp.]